MPDLRLTDINHIIFDLDDTLYPQSEYTRQCMYFSCQIIKKYFDIPIEKLKNGIDEVLNRNGIESKHNYDDLWKLLNIDGKKYFPEILQSFRSAKPNIKPFKNTIEVLKHLKNKGYTLSIITDGPINIQKYKIENLGIKDFFTKIIYTDSFGPEGRKPNDIGFKTLLNELKAKGCECVYIGNDPNKDFIPAKKTCMHSIRILQGEYKDIRLNKETEAEFEINEISEIENILGGKNG